ncbi:hypothetical protein IMCC3317_16070 [Kordia antarctica]|uniref:DUF3570 domain-containing protein n=1 Tax=Kordia antarctica TaxID=1218801 RepID=A0A7L4ZHQ0_9FLAO|nr:DUF3570 domain-containing protein [Kordia antarctica]QHI36248.1 hypothetical protein IMCC3317_16070 [Kordia antarctica]
MKYTFLLIVLFVSCSALYAQEQQQDSLTTYKKRVLETTEVDFIMSYYTQDGTHAAVTGGKGTEELTDITPTFVIAIPLNDDDVLTIDAGISAYTSASSSNINPFDGDKPADPFTASSGASQSDIWGNLNVNYSHSSDDRNDIWTANVNVASEYDYFSIGFGGSYTKLFNEKNTEIGVKANIFLDTWNPQYPIEFRDGFSRPDIVGTGVYSNSFEQFANEGRNTYSLSLSFSQILSKNAQASIFLDLVQQDGLLSTPHQRVYFADVADFFVQNFQLGDDVERLPDTRFKVPIGARFNYYINESVALRTYYRYYFDDWGINAHTASIEVPIKFAEGKFTLYPTYRYYTQTAADYFAPFEEHLSTSEFYTSDYDLSKFESHQYGAGFKYNDIFAKFKIFKFGLKSVDIRYNYYTRSDGLDANIISAGFKFVMD